MELAAQLAGVTEDLRNLNDLLELELAHEQRRTHRLAGECADLPGAAAFYGSSLALPFYNGLRDADIDRVVDSLAAVIGT